MGRQGRDVTDAELAVLQQLWEGGETSIRRLTDALYPGGGASDYATVQKLLSRLEKKGCVSRRRDGGRHLYEARLQRDELIDRRLRETAETLCEGSVTPLITNLVRGHCFSAAERQNLRDLIDELDRGESTDSESEPTP